MNRFPLPNERRCQVVARALLGVIAVIVVVAGVGGGGYWYGRTVAPSREMSREALSRIESVLAQERKSLDDASRESQAQLDAFAARVGEMQAEILRLNALGERLVDMADLDSEEFDFESPPSVGGPEDVGAANATSLDELMGETKDMVALISDRKRKLEQLEQSIMEKDLEKQATPSGWPIRSGYISSKFGYRRNPTGGRTRFHTGVDFASKRGTPVHATADGVVVFSGWRSGYGRLVEIRHVDGMITRYAHNQTNLVAQGEMVEKGQVIAKLGSTGHSTGPHVHFEVRIDDQAVNPLKYIRTTSKKTNS